MCLNISLTFINISYLNIRMMCKDFLFFPFSKFSQTDKTITCGVLAMSSTWPFGGRCRKALSLFWSSRRARGFAILIKSLHNHLSHCNAALISFSAASMKVWKRTGSSRSSEALLDTSGAAVARFLSLHHGSAHLLHVFQGNVGLNQFMAGYLYSEHECYVWEKPRNTWSDVSDLV